MNENSKPQIIFIENGKTESKSQIKIKDSNEQLQKMDSEKTKRKQKNPTRRFKEKKPCKKKNTNIQKIIRNESNSIHAQNESSSLSSKSKINDCIQCRGLQTERIKTIKKMLRLLDRMTGQDTKRKTG
jgi:hypothetical protein